MCRHVPDAVDMTGFFSKLLCQILSVGSSDIDVLTRQGAYFADARTLHSKGKPATLCLVPGAWCLCDICSATVFENNLPVNIQCMLPRSVLHLHPAVEKDIGGGAMMQTALQPGTEFTACRQLFACL